jgi:hypothetical protein
VTVVAGANPSPLLDFNFTRYSNCNPIEYVIYTEIEANPKISFLNELTKPCITSKVCLELTKLDIL